MIDKTESAVETLRDAMATTRNGCDYFATGEEDYRALLDRVIDAPTDADGNLLSVGDEVTSWGFDGEKRVTSFRLYDRGLWEACVEGCEGWTCSDLHKVMHDSPESIDDVRKAKDNAIAYLAQSGVMGWADLNTFSSDFAQVFDRAYACGRRDGAGGQA